MELGMKKKVWGNKKKEEQAKCKKEKQ